ncbi:hypothetical protein J6E39_06665 [bacterium]|nr:hypothetical protein [bacterium]
MAQLLLFNTVSETYKKTAEALDNVKLTDKVVIRKTLTEMMKQSFFHGANRYGYNFIA